jgi:hypothetical protein
LLFTGGLKEKTWALISNPPFIGIIHLSVLELCVLERTLRFNHSNATGIDIMDQLRTKPARKDL